MSACCTFCISDRVCAKPATLYYTAAYSLYSCRTSLSNVTKSATNRLSLGKATNNAVSLSVYATTTDKYSLAFFSRNTFTSLRQNLYKQSTKKTFAANSLNRLHTSLYKIQRNTDAASYENTSRFSTLTVVPSKEYKETPNKNKENPNVTNSLAAAL